MLVVLQNEIYQCLELSEFHLIGLDGKSQKHEQ